MILSCQLARCNAPSLCVLKPLLKSGFGRLASFNRPSLGYSGINNFNYSSAPRSSDNLCSKKKLDPLSNLLE
nr:hypothetical protein BSM_13590 [uncultured archaeon]